MSISFLGRYVITRADGEQEWEDGTNRTFSGGPSTKVEADTGMLYRQRAAKDHRSEKWLCTQTRRKSTEERHTIPKFCHRRLAQDSSIFPTTILDRGVLIFGMFVTSWFQGFLASGLSNLSFAASRLFRLLASLLLGFLASWLLLLLGLSHPCSR